jgi:cytoskeleton protein RodZ
MRVAVRLHMGDVGARLRTAREKAGLTIEEISARTRIKASALAAIERGEFHRLPGEFFTRAFLGTYARELKLPVAEVMAEYDSGRPVQAAPAQEAPAPNDGNIVESLRRFPMAGMTGALLALGFVLIAGAVVLNRPAPSAGPAAAEQGAVGTLGASPANPAPSSTATEPAALSAPATLAVEIRPSRRLWVTGYADGKRVLFRNIAAGERVALEGTELSFRVGDAGAFEYTINGAAARPPGGSGEVREFRITRDNYSGYIR